MVDDNSSKKEKEEERSSKKVITVCVDPVNLTSQDKYKYLIEKEHSSSKD